jgi:hypothetical protein
VARVIRRGATADPVTDLEVANSSSILYDRELTPDFDTGWVAKTDWDTSNYVPVTHNLNRSIDNLDVYAYVRFNNSRVFRLDNQANTSVIADNYGSFVTSGNAPLNSVILGIGTSGGMVADSSGSAFSLRLCIAYRCVIYKRRERVPYLVMENKGLVSNPDPGGITIDPDTGKLAFFAPVRKVLTKLGGNNIGTSLSVAFMDYGVFFGLTLAYNVIAAGNISISVDFPYLAGRNIQHVMTQTPINGYQNPMTCYLNFGTTNQINIVGVAPVAGDYRGGGVYPFWYY